MIGKDGFVTGDIYARDAVIAGRVLGGVYAESHLALQGTSEISGNIQARRIHVEDGAALQGTVAVREERVERVPAPIPSAEAEQALAS